jgi:hypothetical protein
VGPAGGEGSADVAGVDSAAPPATFLTEMQQKATGDAAAAPAEGEAKPEGDAAAPAEPPVTFDPTKLTLPEGVALDEELSKSFSDLLNDPALSPQERGQQLIDLHTKTIESTTAAVAEQMTKANRETWENMNKEWRAQIAALPEFKGNPDAEAGKILQACTAVGAGPAFFAALDMTGAGNHPEILQVLHKLAQPFIEGGAVGGGANQGPARKPGQNIYTSTQG